MGSSNSNITNSRKTNSTNKKITKNKSIENLSNNNNSAVVQSNVANSNENNNQLIIANESNNNNNTNISTVAQNDNTQSNNPDINNGVLTTTNIANPVPVSSNTRTITITETNSNNNTNITSVSDNVNSNNNNDNEVISNENPDSQDSNNNNNLQDNMNSTEYIPENQVEEGTSRDLDIKSNSKTKSKSKHTEFNSTNLTDTNSNNSTSKKRKSIATQNDNSKKRNVESNLNLRNNDANSSKQTMKMREDVINGPINKRFKNQVDKRRSNNAKEKSNNEKENADNNKELENPPKVTQSIPAKRPNVVQLTAINPTKRITRSMSKVSSLEGENNINKTSSENNNETINLLVSNNKYLIPGNFKDVLKSPQKDKWLKGCNDELKAMKDLNVYKVINRNEVKGKSIIKGRWVFTVKQEVDGSEKFKARLVAKGFTQELGQNYLETFSPVISMESLRFMLSLSAINGWFINQLDAKNAFLNGKLKYDIYFDPPEGCNMKKNYIWKLNKALYGLKNAPLIFYQTLSEVLFKSGFKSSHLDQCILYNEKLQVYIAMYVDDLLIFSKYQENIIKVKKLLNQNFEMKDMGIPKIFLGITIKRYNPFHLKLTMEDTINKLESDYNIKVKQRMINTPIDKGFDAEDTISPLLNDEKHSEYRKVIGSLIYIANTVRLDISYSVSLLSRYLVSPRVCHLNAAYRVVHYLIQTKSRGLNYTDLKDFQIPTKDYRLINTDKNAIIYDYPKQGEYLITTVTDASFSNELERKSQSGSISYLNNNIISWMSKRQAITALSSAEAEYISMTDSLKTNVHLTNLLKELKFDCSYGKLCGDNFAALQLSSHKVQHQRTKHIDLRYHYIREQIKNRKVKLDYINTKLNTADCLTKLVDTQTMKTLGELLFKSPN